MSDLTIEDRVSHLANLTFLMDYHQKLGGPINKWIAKEFHDHNDSLIEVLKDKHDETRNGNKDSVSSKDRTQVGSNQPRRS